MITLAIVFIFGAMVGSFLNVCVYRLPKEESIVSPGSHCYACGKPVRPYDNIPVLSYFILRGKCRDCGAKFSIQYALVEIFTGILFILFYQYFGLTAAGAIYLIFALAILTESLIDFEHKIIPDAITLPGVVLGLILSILFPQTHGSLAGELFFGNARLTSFLDSLIGVLIGGGFLYLIAIIAEKILKKEAMGGGDIKLLAMIGAFFGLRGAVWSLFAGSVLGSIAGIYFKFMKKEAEIPFGPFLGLGAIFYLFFGARLLHWYTSLLQVGY